MTLGLGNLFPMLDYRAIRAYNHCRADNTFDTLPVHDFFTVCTVCFHHPQLRIGKQDKRQREILDELVMRLEAVFTYPENNRIEILQQCMII